MHKSIIRLSELPPEGRSYNWDRKSGELNLILEDLIKKQSYNVDFEIKPINSRDFMMTGLIQTEAPENCSLCGLDFNLPIQIKIHEILIPFQPQERTSQYTKVNHVSDAPEYGPQSVEYEENECFNMGNYVHEAIGITLPFSPKPASDGKGDCVMCGLNFETHDFGFDEPMEVQQPESPFAVLKKLKLQ
jgi:uncharacterized protein